MKIEQYHSYYFNFQLDLKELNQSCQSIFLDLTDPVPSYLHKELKVSFQADIHSCVYLNDNDQVMTIIVMSILAFQPILGSQGAMVRG